MNFTFSELSLIETAVDRLGELAAAVAKDAKETDEDKDFRERLYHLHEKVHREKIKAFDPELAKSLFPDPVGEEWRRLAAEN